MGSNKEKESKLEEQKIIRQLTWRKRMAYLFCAIFAAGAGVNISVGMGQPTPDVFYIFAVLQIIFLFLENNVASNCDKLIEHIKENGLDNWEKLR